MSERQSAHSRKPYIFGLQVKLSIGQQEFENKTGFMGKWKLTHRTAVDKTANTVLQFCEISWFKSSLLPGSLIFSSSQSTPVILRVPCMTGSCHPPRRSETRSPLVCSQPSQTFLGYCTRYITVNKLVGSETADTTLTHLGLSYRTLDKPTPAHSSSNSFDRVSFID
jgi:hypothetical protein